MFSFKTRKKQVDVHQLLRRAMDATTPNRPPTQGESRWEDRSNRTIPVLLVPYADEQPVGDEHTIALTKNLSSQGVALVLPQPFRAEQVLIGFWLDASGICLGPRTAERSPGWRLLAAGGRVDRADWAGNVSSH